MGSTLSKRRKDKAANRLGDYTATPPRNHRRRTRPRIESGEGGAVYEDQVQPIGPIRSTLTPDEVKDFGRLIARLERGESEVQFQ